MILLLWSLTAPGARGEGAFMEGGDRDWDREDRDFEEAIRTPPPTPPTSPPTMPPSSVSPTRVPTASPTGCPPLVVSFPFSFYVNTSPGAFEKAAQGKVVEAHAAALGLGGNAARLSVVGVDVKAAGGGVGTCTVTCTGKGGEGRNETLWEICAARGNHELRVADETACTFQQPTDAELAKHSAWIAEHCACTARFSRPQCFAGAGFNYERRREGERVCTWGDDCVCSSNGQCCGAFDCQPAHLSGSPLGRVQTCALPTAKPTPAPTVPTRRPTPAPTASPTVPTRRPTPVPTWYPSTKNPTPWPTPVPTIACPLIDDPEPCSQEHEEWSATRRPRWGGRRLSADWPGDDDKEAAEGNEEVGEEAAATAAAEATRVAKRSLRRALGHGAGLHPEGRTEHCCDPTLGCTPSNDCSFYGYYGCGRNQYQVKRTSCCPNAGWYKDPKHLCSTCKNCPAGRAKASGSGCSTDGIEACVTPPPTRLHRHNTHGHNPHGHSPHRHATRWPTEYTGPPTRFPTTGKPTPCPSSGRSKNCDQWYALHPKPVKISQSTFTH